MFGRKPICPITRKTIHKFDPATHRCECGQWERGHKPAKEPVRPRAECQICERVQATVSGRLGHHGYTRPGCGFITGDCMGVNHEPYPKTDALELYKRAIEGHIERANAKLAEVPTLTHIMYRWTIKYGSKKGEYEVKVMRGDSYRHNYEQTGYSVPDFDHLEKTMKLNLETDIRHATAELHRVEKRIVNANV